MAGCYAIFHKQLGDLVLLEPALRRLHEHHGAPVQIVTRTGHAPLVSLIEGAAFVRGAALRPHGHLYCFDPLNKSALRSALAPALRKICLLPEARERQWFHRSLFHPVIVPELRDTYVARYFWENLPFPAKEAFHPPRLNKPPAHWRPADFAAAPFILINPTSGWRKKSWTAEGWAAVIAAARARTGCRIVMTSSSTDWQIEHCAEITALTGGAVESLASGTTLENFLWLCAHARAVLSVDGAASHLAGAFGVNNLTLFGPTSMHNWHHTTVISRAVQAPPSKDGVARLRNLMAADVIAAADPLLE